jgi:hypothetical protein
MHCSPILEYRTCCRIANWNITYKKQYIVFKLSYVPMVTLSSINYDYSYQIILCFKIQESEIKNEEK